MRGFSCPFSSIDIFKVGIRDELSWGDLGSLSLETQGLRFKYSTNVGKDLEKREPSYTIDGNVNWCSQCGKQYGDFSKN